jgi:hypothetical protein
MVILRERVINHTTHDQLYALYALIVTRTVQMAKI